MKIKKIIALSFVCISSLCLSSCHIDGTSYSADSENGYKEAFALIKKNVDENYKVYDIKFETSDPQGNKIETVTIKMVNDKDMAFSQKFLLTGNMVALETEAVSHTFEAPEYKYVKGIDLNSFDTKSIITQIKEAKELIPEGGKFISVYDYYIHEEVPAGNDYYEEGDPRFYNQSTSFSMSFSQKVAGGQEGIAIVRVIVDENGKAKLDI